MSDWRTLMLKTPGALLDEIQSDPDGYWERAYQEALDVVRKGNERNYRRHLWRVRWRGFKRGFLRGLGIG